jgi:hypothetical protein
MPHDPPGTAEDFYAKILTSVSTKSQEHVKVSRAAIDELRDQFNRLVVVADRDGEDKLNLKTIDRHLKAAKREISRAQREIAELVKELRRREISG